MNHGVCLVFTVLWKLSFSHRFIEIFLGLLAEISLKEAYTVNRYSRANVNVILTFTKSYKTLKKKERKKSTAIT